ncbi:MAG: alpha/beta fold hydrolase [Pararhodobacter sp.]|nr:alpha/beta fold hydrolase [Pararhodobacter sp.]
MIKRKLVSASAELEFHDSGQGEAILFLHGFRKFNADPAFVDKVNAFGRLIAPVHPGFNEAQVPPWLDSADDAAHLYLGLLDELGIDRFHLAGAALGGWIAAEMASMAPERLKSLTLFAPVGVKLGTRDALDIPDLYKFSNEELIRAYHAPGSDAAFDPDQMSDHELADFFRSREAVALYAWEPWMHNPKLRHRLKRVACPALLARGEKDQLVAEWYLRDYAALFPSANVSQIPGAGHDLLQEAPAEVAALLTKHCAVA